MTSTDPTASPAPPRRPWLRRVRKLASRATLVVLAALIGALAMRAWMSRGAPDLAPWHTLVPTELDADELDRTDWAGYLTAEERAFAQVADEMRDLDPADQVRFNRYYEKSLVSPGQFAVDWNRSFVLEPERDAVGVVVLLHGMTDSPYSLRHIAEIYRKHGYVALGLRLPAHGTVPGALTRIEWEDWAAAVRLVMREAARRAGGTKPIHVVGYSNGGALAVKYALDALEDGTLTRPTRLIILSPMIGVSSFARFAGIAGWPAVLPAFSKSAWLDNVLEFNPFKYNSFPVNAARQSYLLTDALQSQLLKLKENGQLAQLPPILTFQSMVDATVLTSAVASSLYANLSANGSELVLFDVNRAIQLSEVLRQAARALPDSIMPPAPRDYRVTVITNRDVHSREMVTRSIDAGSTEEAVEPLGLTYPEGVVSLSHIAVPFPVTDGLYGITPDPQDNFGIPLGTLNLRGERGVLVSPLESTGLRLASNPFFPYIATRIEALLSSQ